jgi:hypothetical protein
VPDELEIEASLEENSRPFENADAALEVYMGHEAISMS